MTEEVGHESPSLPDLNNVFPAMFLFLCTFPRVKYCGKRNYVATLERSAQVFVFSSQSGCCGSSWSTTRRHKIVTLTTFRGIVHAGTAAVYHIDSADTRLAI